MTGIIVRRAGPSDAEAVRDLTRLAYSKWVDVLGRSPGPMDADYQLAVVQNLIDLHERDGRLVGLVEMATNAEFLLIINLAVAPDQQGQGIGVALLAHAGEVARQSGLGEVRLYTNGLMAANVAFYARHGFAEFLREQHEKFGEVVHMRRLLA